MLRHKFSFHAKLLASNIKERLRHRIIQIRKREPITPSSVPFKTQSGPSLRGDYNPLSKRVMQNSEPQSFQLMDG